MKISKIGLLGMAGIAVCSPSVPWAASSKAEVKLLQQENRDLADQLQKAQDEIRQLKEKNKATENATRGPREMNAPLPLSPEEQEAAPGNAAASPATPPGDGQKDWAVAVGTKIWLTEWTTWRTPNFNANDSGLTAKRGSNISTLTSDSNSEVSPIPNLTLRYKDFFFSGSYLAETNYDFAPQSQIYDVRGSAAIAGRLDYKLSGSRREWDVTLGYQIMPYLAVTAGYKEIEQKFFQESCSVSASGSFRKPCLDKEQLNGRFTYAGPTLGLTGAAPIGHGVGLYGNFTYGWLGANYSDDTNTGNAVDDVDYYVGEVGLTYTHLTKSLPLFVPLSSATAYAGYRYQTYESDIPGVNKNKPKDIVQGFVVGVNLAY